MKGFVWKRLKKGSNRGLTLIEMLIGLVIVSVLIVAVLSLYSKGQQNFMNGNIHADLVEGTRYPFAWIARDVKTATKVAASWGSYTTSANTLVLQVPSVDANGLIIDITAHSDYFIYRRFNNKLQRIIDAKGGVSARADSSRYLADDLAGLSLTYYDSSDNQLSSGFDTAASVRVALTTSRKGFQRNFQETLNSKFKLRNK